MTNTMMVPAHILSREIDDDTVILDLNAGIYYGLSGVGTLVWRRISAGASFDDICSAVTTSFDVSAETAASDVRALLDDLAGKKLVLVENEAT